MSINIDKVAIIAGQRETTYGQMLYHIGMFASQRALAPASRCLIFCNNCEGWVYTLYSIWMHGAIAVPVDATSTVEDLAYIIGDCHPECIWTSHSKIDTVEDAMIMAGCEATVMFIDDYATIDPDENYHYSHSMKEYNGIAIPSTDLLELKMDDVMQTAVIIYTSGTTGNPKGVMLSFDNLLVNIIGISETVPIITPERRAIMLLPVHHVLPLQGTVIVPIKVGCGIAICPSLSGKDIMETLNRGKVGYIVGVPRLWQTLYRTLKMKIDSNTITRFLFWMCEKVDSRSLSHFVFQSIKKKMGGHLVWCVSGGAALDKEIYKGLTTLGLDVVEGYGMTEAAPIIAFNRLDDLRPGCVGKPLDSVECKLVDGELYARGRNIMQGYYNRPEETADVLKDGWLRTGDLATIDAEGRVTITGRSKEIIVLSNGKNVNPAELEFKLEKFTEQVKEAAVVADGDRLCAIIVPQAKWAKGKTAEDVEELLKSEVLQPYNQSVENYKKVMSLFVYEDELPRTRLDKLQRFKLKEIIKKGAHSAPKKAIKEPTFEEYRMLKQYIMNEKHLDSLLPTDNIETDLAFDSLEKVEMQGWLDHTFGVQMNVDEISQFKNISEMAERVADMKTHLEMADFDWHTFLHEEHPGVTLPKTWATGPWIVSTFKTLFKMQFRLASKGTKNIPRQGNFIMAANHQSYLDGMFVMSYVPLSQIRNTYFFAKEKHVKKPIIEWIAGRHNIIVLEQNNMKDSIVKLGDVLKQGKNIIIFPEGTRTETGDLGEFKKMFSILSVEFGVPIVPVVINGAFEAMPKGKKIPLPKKIVVEFLPQILPSLECTYDDVTAQVKNAIQAKLK